MKGYCNRITADLTMFPFFSAYSLLPHRCCTNTVGLAAAFQLRRTYHYNQQQTRHSPDFLCGQGVIADAVQVPPSSPLQQHRLSHPATDTLMSYWKAEEEEAGAAKGRRSDSNPGRPFLAMRHVVCSSNSATRAPRVQDKI